MRYDDGLSPPVSHLLRRIQRTPSTTRLAEFCLKSEVSVYGEEEWSQDGPSWGPNAAGPQVRLTRLVTLRGRLVRWSRIGPQKVLKALENSKKKTLGVGFDLILGGFLPLFS